MKQKFLISLMILSLVYLAGCSPIQNTTNNQDGVANPASEYCEKNGGILEIVPDEGGSRGKCNFEDGSFCEERAYYHGECSPGRGNGNIIDIEEVEDNEEISEQEKEKIVGLIEDFGDEKITCTADVKMCDDGTYVSRGGPNCQFSPCPGVAVDENIVQETLKKYESTGSDLSESDIDLMKEIISIMTE